MPKVSVIMPLFNMERYVAAAVTSALAQSYPDFELLIVDDGSTDRSVEICRSFTDPRIRIIHQENRGLASARNTGIGNSLGDYIAFLDADDVWRQAKLDRHLAHLKANTHVGVSYCRAAYMGEDGRLSGIYQKPKLRNITPYDLFVRDPVTNGSSPVIRRCVFEEIGRPPPDGPASRSWYFDESLERCEDWECWIRIASTTRWRFEGVPEVLVHYRTNRAGLSASLEKQFRSWNAMMEKVSAYAPELVTAYGSLAKACELRYLAQTSLLVCRDGGPSLALMISALRCNPQILIKQQPSRTVLTLIAALLWKLLPAALYGPIEARAIKLVALLQRLTLPEMRLSP